MEGVVPYVGTWIEMLPLLMKKDEFSRSLRGNVDRNFEADKRSFFWVCRSLRGNVDRNTSMIMNGLPSAMSFPTWERG